MILDFSEFYHSEMPIEKKALLVQGIIRIIDFPDLSNDVLDFMISMFDINKELSSHNKIFAFNYGMDFLWDVADGRGIEIVTGKEPPMESLPEGECRSDMFFIGPSFTSGWMRVALRFNVSAYPEIKIKEKNLKVAIKNNAIIRHNNWILDFSSPYPELRAVKRNFLHRDEKRAYINQVDSFTSENPEIFEWFVNGVYSSQILWRIGCDNYSF